MPKPNRVVSASEFNLREADKEIERLRKAINSARHQLLSCKEFWENDWDGAPVKGALTELDNALK